MGYLSWILGLLGVIMLGLIKDEISAWLPRLATWCVSKAASRMHDRERCREEWLAHLEECPGRLSQLAHAFGVLGMSQAQRCRFWLEVLYYLPGVRWSVIDGFVAVAETTTACLFLYSWFMSGNYYGALAAISILLVTISIFTGRRAEKLLSRDQELIKSVIAYRKARGEWRLTSER